MKRPPYISIVLAGLLGIALAAATEKPEPAYTLKSLAPEEGYYCVGGSWCYAYSGITRTCRWSLERLDNKTKSGDRSGLSFRVDAFVPAEFAASPADYAESGYDIGHQACARNHGPGREDIKATETVANACPQTAELNRGEWNQLEAYVYDYAHAVGVKEIWVLTAPAWIPEHGMLHCPAIGKHHVFVPTHCCKAILVVFNDGSLKMQAWCFENDKDPRSIEAAKISVDEFEDKVGLDAWPGLPKDVQDKLEAVK